VTQLADGVPHLIGIVDGEQRAAWEKICELGSAQPKDLARETGMPPERAERTLETLWRRRLVIRQESGYFPLRGISGLNPGGLLAEGTGTSGGGGVVAS
jgi:hypothetical protein